MTAFRALISQLRQRPRLLLADADPAVGDGARRGRELAGEAGDGVRLDAGVVGGALGRPGRGRRLQLRQAVAAAVEAAEAHAAVGEDRVQHPQQQVGVAAGADRDVLGGVLGGLRVPRVDDHDPAAAVADRPDPVAHARRRHQRAVGDGGVGAEQQHVPGAVDVGDRQHEVVAEHLLRAHVLRQLVGRGRRVVVARAQQLAQERRREHRRGVGAGVPGVGRERVSPVLVLNPSQPLRGEPERLLPADLDELTADLLHRLAQAVGVALDVGERGRLGADVAAREDVVGVAGDPHRLATLDLDPNAAVRLAERALPVDHPRHAQTPRLVGPLRRTYAIPRRRGAIFGSSARPPRR